MWICTLLRRLRRTSKTDDWRASNGSGPVAVGGDFDRGSLRLKCETGAFLFLQRRLESGLLEYAFPPLVVAFDECTGDYAETDNQMCLVLDSPTCPESEHMLKAVQPS